MSDLSTAQKDKLMADLRVVIADAEEVLRVTAGQAGEGVKEARGRMLASMETAKTNLTHLQEAAVAKAKAAGQAADVYVHDNPWTAMGAAAGLGLLVGLLISRR
ncbi:MAG: DUF883 domain-containing protein [Ideonella sp.]|jgi:ElaB/YqjD/DUF883 family membrane-anchored ribosome-binding protein|nr:DUF883 domain-containing protein [Ideonella sp.]MBL0148038.1 DUF883 domain-containing protein [Ideonella sp.]